MNFGGMNVLAIAVAALAAFAFGALYYRALGPLLTRSGATVATLTPGTLAVMLVADLVAAWVLAGTLGHLGVGQVTLRNGVISAGFVWFGFMATVLAVALRLHGIGWRRVLVDAVHWLAAVLIMGAVIGGIGV